jgi:hypothetical protein
MKRCLFALAITLALAASALAVNLIRWHPAALVTANTTMDGTSGAIAMTVQPQAQDVYVDKLVVRHAGTNSTATVIRVFINNGEDWTIAANNILFTEATVAASTVSQTAASPGVDIDLTLWLPAGYRIFCTTGTAGGSSGWYISAVMGDSYQP